MYIYIYIYCVYRYRSTIQKSSRYRGLPTFNTLKIIWGLTTKRNRATALPLHVVILVIWDLNVLSHPTKRNPSRKDDAQKCITSPRLQVVPSSVFFKGPNICWDMGLQKPGKKMAQSQQRKDTAHSLSLVACRRRQKIVDRRLEGPAVEAKRLFPLMGAIENPRQT